MAACLQVANASVTFLDRGQDPKLTVCEGWVWILLCYMLLCTGVVRMSFEGLTDMLHFPGECGWA